MLREISGGGRFIYSLTPTMRKRGVRLFAEKALVSLYQSYVVVFSGANFE
jgi:hypothetical protein